MVEGESKVKHDTFCNETWPVLESINMDSPENCSYYMEQFDYNMDGYVNYREIVPFGYLWIVQGFYEDNKGPNINCSLCSGMDVYNV